MSKANINSIESKQFINRKVFEFKTRKKELEETLSSSPELSDEGKEAKRKGLTKALREETSTEEYQEHLRKVLEDSRMIMLFAKQKFGENPTKDQIDEIRTQFYGSEMDYNDIDSHTDLLNDERKLGQFIVDKFGDSEKTLILLAQYNCRGYLEKTFFNESSLVQQWKKFFNEPLGSEYDSLTTPESVRYHYGNTLQADIIIFKKFGNKYPSSKLNEKIIGYFIDHADKGTLNKKMLHSIYGDFDHVNFNGIPMDKFDEDAQEEIQKIRQGKEEDRKKEESLAEKRRLAEEERRRVAEEEKRKERRAENAWKVTKVVTFPIRGPIVGVTIVGDKAVRGVIKGSRKVVSKIKDYNSPYAKRERKEERRQRKEERRQRKEERRQRRNK